MAPKFGTSGLRGLVIELTDPLIGHYVRAFLASCPQNEAVYIGRDLRASSPRIGEAVIGVVRAAGFCAIDCGAVPTPALALASLDQGAAAIMITGSHIPADRNGLKFYVPSGEISKADEAVIMAALAHPHPDAAVQGERRDDLTCAVRYLARYRDAFGPSALAGLRIGVYEHSSVARDILGQAVVAVGGSPVPLARSEIFIPVDTEAVDPGTRGQLADWAASHALDAIISTDGDGDRPMLTDATGRIVPGDVLGALTARFLGATTVVTPVSSNTQIDQMDGFSSILRTRIGSPFVIAAMEALRAADPTCRVAGYEANGGFLLGFTAQGPTGPLAPLMTRDSLLPILAPLAAARAGGKPVAALVAALPKRFTSADRVTEIDSNRAAALLADLEASPAARAAFFANPGAEAAVDLTDGLRVIFIGGDILHLRLSGNAPEFRCYSESGSPERAEDLVRDCLNTIRQQLV